MPALWLDDDLKAAKRHVHFEVLRSIPIQATVTTGTDSEKQPLRQTLEEGRLKKQKGNSSWQKSSRPLLGGGWSSVARSAAPSSASRRLC
jgi:hypothetical protein